MNRLTPDMFEPPDDDPTFDESEYYRGYKYGRAEQYQINRAVVDRWIMTLAWTRLVCLLLSTAVLGMLLQLFGC